LLLSGAPIAINDENIATAEPNPTPLVAGDNVIDKFPSGL